MSKILAFIPARYNSSRFPGKPLALIAGKPMIQWVYEKVKTVGEIHEVYVATDNDKIFECVKAFGGNVIMTSESHGCGTDRLAECIEKTEADDNDIILNIQGDEPMIKGEMIKELISAFEDKDVYMATLKKRLDNENDICNPNIAKVITDSDAYAIYFSRSVIPYNRDKVDNDLYYKHIGVYGYKAFFLRKYPQLKNRYLETMEQLEQLRAIENGYKIKVLETSHQSIGVDLKTDISKVEQLLK